MIPEGTYSAVVTPINTEKGSFSCQFGESGQKRTPLVTVAFKILRGPEAGRRISWYGYFPGNNDEVVDRTIKALRACGFTGDDLAAFQTQTVEQEVSIVVEHDEYQGRKQAKVAWVNAVGGGLRVENQMDAGGLRVFSARLKSRVKATAAHIGPKAVEEAATPATAGAPDGFSQAPPPAASDDDIPLPGPQGDDDIPFDGAPPGEYE